MEAYSDFASVYDLFMDNIDYDKWSRYLADRLKYLGIPDGLVCELGCGTGQITERLAASGYNMIGIDRSAEMLEKAFEKKSRSGSDTLYLMQDMRSFELYGTVRAVISVCDSLNYITKREDLLQVFRLVNNYLDPEGIFLFDLNTDEKYRSIGDRTIAENREEGSFIWENQYDGKNRINTYQLTLFLPEGDLFRKVEELHVQKAWRPEEVCSLLEEAGLEALSVEEAFTGAEPSAGSERLYFTAREKGKKERIARGEL